MNMTPKHMYDILYAQLARDFCCSIEQIESNENVFLKKKLMDGRRRYRPDDYLLRAASIHGKALFCVEDRALPEVKQRFETVAAPWMDMFQTLYQLNTVAKRYGYRICDQHHYYIPTGVNLLRDDELEKVQENVELTWYERDELNVFRGDPRFCHALGFVETAPDVLCVTASVNGEIVGMSGASEDSKDMWQIGIDVAPECRGMNIGPFLVIQLKEAILRRGVLPYYGTAESHIQSQRVALKSGFLPAWWEVQTEPVPRCVLD